MTFLYDLITIYLKFNVWENLFPNKFMKIKNGQFREIADILLQVHAYKKVILLSLQMLGKGGACFYHRASILLNCFSTFQTGVCYCLVLIDRQG
jgi:hypothetical protein